MVYNGSLARQTLAVTGLQSKVALASTGALVLYALALGLRWPGLGFLLPLDLEPDAVWAVLAKDLAAGIAPAGEHATAYPNVVPYLAHALRQLCTTGAPQTWNEHLMEAAAPAFYPRVIAALASAGAASFTYLMARRFVGVRWAFFAGLLCATSLFLTQYSVQGRPHALLATTCAACAWSGLRVLERGRWLDAAIHIAACLAGVLILQSALLACGVLPVVQLLRRGGRRGVAQVLALAASVALAVKLAWPKAPWESGTAHLEVKLQFDGSNVINMVRWFYAADPLLSLLCSVACLLLLKRWIDAFAARPAALAPSARALVVGSAFLPLGLTFATFHMGYPRFFVPLVPLAALLAAWLLARWMRTEMAGARVLSTLVALLTLGVSASASARFAWLRTQQSTLDVAAEWIERTIPPDQVIAFVPAAELGLRYDAADVERMDQEFKMREALFWLRYLAQHKPEPSLRAGRRVRLIPRLALQGPLQLEQWVALGTRPNWLVLWGSIDTVAGPGSHLLSGELAAGSEYALELPSLLDARRRPAAMSYDDLGEGPLETWKRLWSAQRLGPVVRVLQAK